ncbi:MAG: hypothetical protein ABI629_09755 [bacterium]
MSFAGAISQAGCPFCCEFTCRLTPTPTPLIDEAGRQIFVHGVGQFLLVVEGVRGPSNRNAGTNVFPFGSDRGDLQILLSRPTGDPRDGIGFGSAAVCDMGPPPTPFGGVPGINPPDFAPGAQITSAIQDLECRFTTSNDSASACTRNRFGAFSYLSSGARTQYCYHVPLTGEFQTGDTVVSIQLRDGAGNVGPHREFVVRVLP